MSYLKRAKYELFSLSLIFLCLSGMGCETALAAQGNRPPVIMPISNINLEAGDMRRIMVSSSDPDGASGLKLSLISAPGFASLTDNGNGTGVIQLAPSCSETQSGTITVQATDSGGLSAQTSFNATVSPNQPPKIIVSANDITVSVCEPVSVTVDVETGGNPTRLTIISAPAYITLIDNGNGDGSIRISPALTDTQGGVVLIQATDSCGLTSTTSIKITLQRCLLITTATYSRPNLFISGIGFGSSGARVLINGQDVSSRIIGQSDSSITLKGSRKKLNLRKGQNKIEVISGGITSNAFVLNF